MTAARRCSSEAPPRVFLCFTGPFDGSHSDGKSGASDVAARGTGPGGLAERYATALFDLADDKKQLHQTAADLTTLKGMLAESEDLRRLINTPLIKRDDKRRAILAVVERAGLGDLVRRFVAVLADNRRLYLLPQAIDGYLAHLAARRGEMTAQVRVARPLSARQQRDLVEALKRTVGARVALDIKIDPALIGGMVVRVGSRMLDSSLQGKLQRLQLAMRGTR
jgi:F-type H+-transporting ATPase subunit delta